MKTVYTILLICGLFMGQAWAVNFIDFVRHNDRGDHITLPSYVEGVTATPDDDVVIDLPEIRALLERCREFVDDNSERFSEKFGVITTTEFNPRRDDPNAIENAEKELERAKAKVERLKRETQLRRDIDLMIERLSE